MILKFQEQFFHQMPFFAGVPVCISGTFGVHTAGNDHNFTPFFYPTNEFATVVSSVSQNQFSGQIKGFQQFLCHADVISIPTGKQKMQWIPRPIRHRMDFYAQTSPAAPDSSPLFSHHWHAGVP